MKKITYVFLFLTLNLASQEVEPYNLMVNSDISYISYEGKHILHDWIGINNKIKGVMVIENGAPNKIAVSVSVKDFDSGKTKALRKARVAAGLYSGTMWPLPRMVR